MKKKLQMIKQALMNKEHKKAFTLIEMLVVLVVVALLMAIIIPNISGQRDRINQQAMTNMSEVIQTQMTTYELAEGAAPTTLDDLLTKGYITQKQSKKAEELFNTTNLSAIANNQPASGPDNGQ